MEDVDKLDNIQDRWLHPLPAHSVLPSYPPSYLKATRLQYLNGQIDLANQNCLQQQHVDWKISNALLKKGTREAYKTWTQQDRAWVDMRLHESHEEGGFGVSHNTITRHAASYTTNARPSKPHPNPRRRPLVAAQPPTRAHTRRLPQAPRTTGMANSSYRNSTAFIWHSSGGRCPHQRPPAIKTSRTSSPRRPSSLPKSVSRSSSPSIVGPSRPCASATQARASRSSASFTCHRNTKPRPWTPPCAWR
jgi:hypothetical protein